MPILEQLEIGEIKELVAMEISKMKLDRIRFEMNHLGFNSHSYLVGIWGNEYWLLNGFDRFHCLKERRMIQKVNCFPIVLNEKGALYAHILKWLFFHRGKTTDIQKCIHSIIKWKGEDLAFELIQSITNIPQTLVETYLNPKDLPNELIGKNDERAKLRNKISDLYKIGLNPQVIEYLHLLELNEGNKKQGHITTHNNIGILRKVIREVHGFNDISIENQKRILTRYLNFREFILQDARRQVVSCTLYQRSKVNVKNLKIKK
ncbi:hypothetical protein [Shouchella patagoniensis]|uniref:hypothetical protein n=1 Tax=Shouchella patagoniensis TaxID=228576 RepID=UPI000995DE1B|nr:hypothetical protein [Shouchella patagoniensis]